MIDDEQRCKRFRRDERRRGLADYKYACKAAQDRLRCPNCRTVWDCHCTLEQVQAGWRRIKARRQAEYHARIRRCDEDLARRQAAWKKQHGEAE